MSKDDIPALMETTRQLMQVEFDKLSEETRPIHNKYDWSY